MKLSDFAINKIIPFITGDNNLSIYRKGQDLVNLFNEYGFRDIYDYQNGGLPKLSSNASRNPSRKEYAEDRFKKLSEQGLWRGVLETVINTSECKELCISEIEEIISPENYCVQESGGKYIISGGRIVKNQEIKNDVSFIHNQDMILMELNKAQVSISLAMAWFTNQTLADKLKEKQMQGVKVEIIIYNDGINTKHGANLDGLDVIKTRGQRGGIMHNKFCVIDNQIVLQGSYNWSSNAEYKNDETVQISEDPKLATKFSVEFRNLKKTLNTSDK